MMTNGIGWVPALALAAVAGATATGAYFGLRPAPDSAIVAPAVVSVPAPELEDVADADPSAALAEDTSPAPQAAPTVDVVRIDAAGGAIVAGTAERNAEVVLRVDGEDVATAQTDDAGNFVSLFDVGVDDIPRVLTIESQGKAKDGTTTRPVVSPDRIIVAPVFPASPEVPSIGRVASAPSTAQRAPENAEIDSAPEVLAEVSTLAPVDASDTSDVPQDRAAPTRVAGPAAPQAPRLFRAGPEGLRVITPGAAPDVVSALAINAISYDAEGAVSLTGTGARDSEVRIYLDGAAVQLAKVGDGGTWSSPLPNVESGVYTLRVDAVAPDGTVSARVETPFQRTAPEVAAASRRDGISAITVQPGFTLWAISEGYFGDGVQYVQIFESNRSQIRDPDLIFPGQVFNLPKVD